jgi:hypothetical protein
MFLRVQMVGRFLARHAVSAAAANRGAAQADAAHAAGEQLAHILQGRGRQLVFANAGHFHAPLHFSIFIVQRGTMHICMAPGAAMGISDAGFARSLVAKALPVGTSHLCGIRLIASSAAAKPRAGMGPAKNPSDLWTGGP